MTIYRFILQSLRKSNPTTTLSALTTTAAASPTAIFTRTYAFSNAEEAAAERRRRKRRLRIEPPLHALRRDPNAPRPPRDPNAPRLPDSTSALTGPRLNLHNRVQSLIRGGDLDAATAIARHAVFSNTRPTVFTCNAVVASTYRAGRYNEAIALFQFFFNQSNIVPNVVSYNNLINTYCDIGKVDTALEVYKHILDNAPFSPSPVSYRHLTKGLIDADRIGDAVDLVREMLNKGHGADSLVYNNIISGFLELGNLERANEFFDELKERCLVYDGVVNATYMEWYFKQGKDKEAMESYKGLLDREFKMTPATCNVLLGVLLKNGKSVEANALFESMLNNHKTPTFHALNSETFNIMVDECFRLGKVEEALAVFRKTGTAPGVRPFQMDGAGYNNLLGKLCELGMLEEGKKIFEEMSNKSVIMDYNTYRFLIEAYFREDKVDNVVLLFENFLFKTNIKANPRFFNMVFGGLLTKGRIVEAADILKEMGEKEEMKPDPTTYELVIIALCKEGKIDCSRDLLGQMARYNISVTPALRSTVDEAFGKEGRTDDIDRILGRQYQGREGAFVRAPQPHQAREGTFTRVPPPPQAREGTFQGAPLSAVHQGREGAFQGAPPSAMHQARERNFQGAPSSAMHQAREGAFQGAPPSAMYQAEEGAFQGAPPSAMHQARQGDFHGAPPLAMHQARQGDFHSAPPSTMHQARQGAFDAPPPSVMHQRRVGAFDGPLPSAMNQGRVGAFAGPPPSAMHQTGVGAFGGPLPSAMYQAREGVFGGAPTSAMYQANEEPFSRAPPSSIL